MVRETEPVLALEPLFGAVHEWAQLHGQVNPTPTPNPAPNPIQTLLLSAPLLALAASLALWLDLFGVGLPILSLADLAGGRGIVLRAALLALAFGGTAAPIVPLAMVPANVDPVEIGRGYGIVESLFEVAQPFMTYP